MLTIGSLFAGIGGLELGLEQTGGFKTVWQVERDKYATRVLERHWPEVKRYDDIVRFIAYAKDDRAGRWSEQPQGFREAGRVDAICGGFPCQPVSLAGNHKGPADGRWLWPSFRRVIGLLRPRYVVIENVRGLLSAASADGRRGGLFGGILRDLARLGYDAEWASLPAAAFGCPHLRWRVFLVANANSERLEERLCKRGDESPQLATVERGAWRAIVPTIRRGNYEFPAELDSRGRLPHRADRLRCLGNAVVPAVARFVGERILEHERLANEAPPCGSE